MEGMESFPNWKCPNCGKPFNTNRPIGRRVFSVCKACGVIWHAESYHDWLERMERYRQQRVARDPQLGNHGMWKDVKEGYKEKVNKEWNPSERCR